MTVLLSDPRLAAVPVRDVACDVVCDVDEPVVAFDCGFGSGKALVPGGMSPIDDGCPSMYADPTQDLRMQQ